MTIDPEEILKKDRDGVRIPQWYKKATESFIEVSEEFPLPTQLLTEAGEPIDAQNPLYIQSAIFDDPGNRSSTPLAAAPGVDDNHIFLGAWTDTWDPHYISFIVTLKADQQGELWIERSGNAIDVGKSTLVTDILVLGEGQRLGDSPSARYIRLRYVNGVVAQTLFRLRLILSTAVQSGSYQMLKQALVDDTMLLNTQAVLAGEDQNGEFPKIRATEIGALMTADFLVEVGRGNIPGYSFIHKYGLNSDLASGVPVDIWDLAIPYTWSTSAIIDTISSSSAADTGLVVIQGLDENWEEVTLIETLDGLNKVVLGTSLLRTYRVINIGPSDFVGEIYLYEDTAIVAGVPTDLTKVRAHVDGDANQTLMAIYTVPAGKTAYLYGNVSALANKNAATVVVTGRARTFGSVFRTTSTGAVTQAGTSIISSPTFVPRGAPGKTDVTVIGNSSANGVALSASFDLLLIDD